MYFLTLSILLVAAFAWWKGGVAERLSGAANAIVAALYLVVQVMISGDAVQVTLMLIDCALALTFLTLAVRYASLFLGAAMILQGAQFSLHAYFIVTDRMMDRVYMLANNVISWLVLACIVVATLVYWSKRRSAAGRARPA